MNMIEHGRAFVESVRSLTRRSVWDWRRCPGCGGQETYKNGATTDIRGRLQGGRAYGAAPLV